MDGFMAGILAGLIFGNLCSTLETVAIAFINVWKITIVPQ
jgi:Na+/H+-dicarboxylate symporter